MNNKGTRVDRDQSANKSLLEYSAWISCIWNRTAVGAMLKGNMAAVLSCDTADNKADVRTDSLVQIPPSCSPRFASFRSLILCELSPLISKDPPRGGLISP